MLNPGRLKDVHRVTVPEKVVTGTLAALREFGEHGCEGLVLWLGRVAATTAEIGGFVVPDQHPVRSEDGVGYFVSQETLFALNRYLSEHDLRLVSQVHSHPGEAYHSETDDAYALVTTEGGLSLVVPDFGCAPANPTRWAVHRLRQGRWRLLTEREAAALIEITEEGE